MTGITYLASCYSHPDPAVRRARFDAACLAAAKLMREGHCVFSPVAHSHPIAEAGNLPQDWEFWKAQDFPMLMCCSRVVVLRIPGWEESVGVKAEIEFVQGSGKLVSYMDGELAEDPSAAWRREAAKFTAARETD